MVENEEQMLRNKESLSKRKRAFEKRNIGSLLIGAKGFLPDFKNPGPENYTWFNEEDHKEKGNFLVGDSLAFFDHAITIKEIHDNYFKAKSVLLLPNEFILGVTKERIKLPKNICGWLSGRSRFARLGLAVHVTANFVQPNINNVQVLEIRNLSEVPLKINSGTKICQIIFQRCEGKAKYKGKFGKQKSV